MAISPLLQRRADEHQAEHPGQGQEARTYRGEASCLTMISAGDSATVEPGIALDLIEDEAFFQDCEQLYTPKPSIGQVEAIACSSEP